MIELLAVAIPLETFDQQKLETLVRKIPAALVRTEAITNGERKFYSFPKLNDKGFRIECQADHFLGNPLPSSSKCALSMLTENFDARNDEHAVDFKDPFTVKNVFNAITFAGSETRKMFSNERVYGVAIDNKYKEHFRYSFTCTAEKCRVTMSTKEVSL